MSSGVRPKHANYKPNGSYNVIYLFWSGAEIFQLGELQTVPKRRYTKKSLSIVHYSVHYTASNLNEASYFTQCTNIVILYSLFFRRFFFKYNNLFHCLKLFAKTNLSTAVGITLHCKIRSHLTIYIGSRVHFEWRATEWGEYLRID